MRVLPAPATGALGSSAVALVTLVELGFATPIRLNTSTWDIDFPAGSGQTYKGAYGLGTISPLTDKAGEVQGIALELQTGDSSIVSLALDDANVVQGTSCTLRTAIIDVSNNYSLVDCQVEWTGYLDTMSIKEDGNSCTVSVTAESKAVDLLRGNPWMYTDQEQMIVNPLDRSFRYVVDQIDKPLIWPAKEFFKR